MMALPPERRRTGDARLPIRVPAETRRLGAANGRQHGEALDLSAGGLKMRLREAIGLGAQVSVTLHLRQRPSLALVGTVAWARPHPELAGWALGIRFHEDLPDGMAAEIADGEFPPWPPSRCPTDPPGTH